MIEVDYDDYIKNYSHLKVNDYMKMIKKRLEREQSFKEIDPIVYDYNEYLDIYSHLTLDEYCEKIETDYYKNIFNIILDEVVDKHRLLSSQVFDKQKIIV